MTNELEGPSGYDVIADVHGHAEKLEALLYAMGYRKKSGAYSHPSRKAIFVGDLIDRGPHQVRTYRLVRSMVEAGSALIVMGNHEFNAIAWHMEDPHEAELGRYLRPRHGEKGSKNRHQHKAFLAEVENNPLHAEVIQWFFTLPLWLDLPGLRVVHACWHEEHMATLVPLLGPERTLTPDLMVRASRENDPVFMAVEVILKGLELELPPGHVYRDKDGHERHRVRARWWNELALSYQDLALLPEDSRTNLPDLLVREALPRYDQKKPVFFGHYWMRGSPMLQGDRIACVDYSVAADGPLVAYRWSGEETLDSTNFVSTAQ